MKKLSPETEAKLDEQQRLRKYAMLGLYENQRAETIAMHYLRHYLIAKQIMDFIHLSRTSSLQDVNEIIGRLVAEITKNHARDLGIKLEWNNETP